VKIATVLVLLLALSLPLATHASAEPPSGAIFAVENAPVLIALQFSVVGQAFAVTILTFGGGGNGRWFIAAGTINGLSGTAQIFSPQGFGFTPIQGGQFQYQLNQADPTRGTFTTTGLSGFINPTSGNIFRVLP